MGRVVQAGRYDTADESRHLAIPRASVRLDVYGLSVDVFI